MISYLQTNETLQPSEGKDSLILIEQERRFKNISGDKKHGNLRVPPLTTHCLRLPSRRKVHEKEGIYLYFITNQISSYYQEEEESE